MGAAARQGAPHGNGRETGFFPQLSLGVAPNADLIALGIVLRRTPAQGPTLFGSGDLLLDVKWRCYESDTLGLAVRAGVDLPRRSMASSTVSASSERLIFKNYE